MPWVNKEMCTGCGICIGECPVDAIEQQADGLAEINEAECIRCGRCHDVCPQEAVRHDSERIPQDVAANLQWVRRLLDNFETPSQRAALMGRMERYFNKEKKVIENTLTLLKAAGDDTTQGLDKAIRSALEPQSRQTH